MRKRYIALLVLLAFTSGLFLGYITVGYYQAVHKDFQLAYFSNDYCSKNCGRCVEHAK
ncbi:MAG: hypothetical protein R3D71_03705 [Rickettsiales bacterium]